MLSTAWGTQGFCLAYLCSKDSDRGSYPEVPSLDVRAEPELQVQGAPGTDNPQDTIPGPRRKNMFWGGHTVRWTDTQ